MEASKSTLNSENVIIGVDPGSHLTGYGIIIQTGPALRCVDYGVIRLPTSLSIPERLVILGEKFERLLAAAQPHDLAIENVFTGKNVQSILKLGHIRGVILYIGVKRDLAIAEYAPATIKQSVIGYGRASKEQIQYMVSKILNLQLPLESKDASDALAVAICHANLKRFKSRLRNNK